MQVKKVLVPTDFSPQAREAYITAASLARKADAEITLVHILESTPPLLYLQQRGISTGIPYDELTNRTIEFLNEETLHPAFHDVQVSAKVVYHGVDYKGLNQAIEEEHADLVVLTPQGRSALGYAVLGSFAQKAVRYADAPVLVCRHGGEFKAEQVLVPFDFSENAEAVFPTIRKLKTLFDPEFTFLYVIEPLTAGLGVPTEAEGAQSLWASVDTLRDSMRDSFEALRAREFPTAKCRFLTTTGPAAAGVVATAKDVKADWVLMSSHGWTGWNHLLLGSVTEKVIHKAPCSVWTTRTRNSIEADTVETEKAAGTSLA